MTKLTNMSLTLEINTNNTGHWALTMNYHIINSMHSKPIIGIFQRQEIVDIIVKPNILTPGFEDSANGP